ncbi:hypothetical protein LINPERPRIM_LOCUS6372 [Linum perenne]
MSDVAAVKCTVDIPSPEIRVPDYGRMVVTGDGAAVHLEKERFLSKIKIQIIAVGYAIITTRGEDLDLHGAMDCNSS